MMPALPAMADAGAWGNPDQCAVRQVPGAWVPPHEAPYVLRDGWLTKGVVHCRLERIAGDNGQVAGTFGARCSEDGLPRDYRLDLVETDAGLTMLWSSLEGQGGGTRPEIIGPLPVCGVDDANG